MKKFNLPQFALSVFLAAALLSTHAFSSDTVSENGGVVYHQDFSATSSLSACGITVGSASTSSSKVNCAGDGLIVSAEDSGRVYTILPEFNHSNTYTVEFDFKFTSIGASNGYLAFLLNCRGDEPTNITSLKLRADGNADGFAPSPEALAEKIKNGDTVNVKIPIENGVMHKIILTADGTEYELESDKILAFSSERMGFSIRNAGVEIPEIFVVNGIGYSEKSGHFATASYSDDNTDLPDDGTETSPATNDMSFALLASVAVSLFLAVKSKRKNGFVK